MSTFGFGYDAAQYADASKVIKEQVKMINSALQGKEYLVGNRVTVADITVFTSLIIAFAFVLDGGFRKAMPNVSAWFQRIASHQAVINTCGNVKLCEKALKAVDPSKLPQVAAKVVEAPKVEAVEVPEVKAADEDEFDPFADEPEDEEAERAKMERMKEIAKTAKSYGKVGPVAKSIIIWEVKPWGEETDLDALAAKILAINMDGLVWKTEYKKEPIAYGVFKLVIGAVVEDLKVSTDDVQDKMIEFEDDVQSVDIQSFNKL
jgi:elongation factor 1-beta